MMNLLVCILSKKKKNLVGLHLVTQMVRQVPLLPPNIQTYNNVGVLTQMVCQVPLALLAPCFRNSLP